MAPVLRGQLLAGSAKSLDSFQQLTTSNACLTTSDHFEVATLNLRAFEVASCELLLVLRKTKKGSGRFQPHPKELIVRRSLYPIDGLSYSFSRKM
jgi:hypothetical protein